MLTTDPITTEYFSSPSREDVHKWDAYRQVMPEKVFHMFSGNNVTQSVVMLEKADRWMAKAKEIARTMEEDYRPAFRWTDGEYASVVRAAKDITVNMPTLLTCFDDIGKGEILLKEWIRSEGRGLNVEPFRTLLKCSLEPLGWRKCSNPLRRPGDEYRGRFYVPAEDEINSGSLSATGDPNNYWNSWDWQTDNTRF